MKHICAKRPFQISAFFLSPKGPRPSLKFHCLAISNEVVVVGRAAAGADAWIDEKVEMEFVLGVTNPLTHVKKRAKRARTVGFIMIIYCSCSVDGCVQCLFVLSMLGQ